MCRLFIMSTSKKVWDPKMEIKLVNLVRQNEHIWNTTHAHFLNLRKRRETFAQIAKYLGKEFTVNTVKERWKNIRNTYRHNLRRTKKLESCSNSNSIYKPSWHLWPLLQFLQNDENHTKNKNFIFDSIKIENENSTDVTDDGLFPDSNENQLDSSDLYCKPEEVMLYNKLTSNKSECEVLLSEAKNILEILQSDPRLDLNIDLKYSNFGKNVASCLSEMPRKDAEDVKRKIKDIFVSYNRSIDDT